MLKEHQNLIFKLKKLNVELENHETRKTEIINNRKYICDQLSKEQIDMTAIVNRMQVCLDEMKKDYVEIVNQN